jgi:hypothetical protein
MKAGILLAFSIALIIFVVTAQPSKAQELRVEGEPEHIIGVVHRDIAESSPLASATISALQSPVKAGEPVKIRIVIENRSDHEIVLPDFGAFVFDARDSNGDLLPETDIGCVFHFFSPCHKYKKMGEGLVATISAHKKYEWDTLLNTEYDLSRPGTYTVVGYVQIFADGSDHINFKTNKIKITVQ